MPHFSEIFVNLDSVVIPIGTSITRGYEDFIVVEISITNTDPVLDVPPVSAPRQNFNITVICSGGGSSRKRRSVVDENEKEVRSDVTMHDVTLKRTKRNTDKVGPFIATNDAGLLVNGLQKGESLTMDLQIGILLPRDTCASLTQICFSVEPAADASYQLAAGNSHSRCLDLTPLKNCEGLYGIIYRIQGPVSIEKLRSHAYDSYYEYEIVMRISLPYYKNFYCGKTAYLCWSRPICNWCSVTS